MSGELQSTSAVGRSTRVQPSQILHPSSKLKKEIISCKIALISGIGLTAIGWVGLVYSNLPQASGINLVVGAVMISASLVCWRRYRLQLREVLT